jgi:molybdenum cofactor guanylyltransferase
VAEPVSAIVLAGGRSSRMGGVDKAWLTLAGKPLLAWVCDRIGPQVDEIILSVNGEDERYGRLGYPVVHDEFPGYAGPLAGLAAGMKQARHAQVLTVPCDTPLLPADLVTQLVAAWRASDARMAVAKSGGRAHHAIMLCSGQLLSDLEAFLAGGGRKVAAWQAAHRAAYIEFGNAGAFRNLNTPADLAELEALLGTAA